MKIGTQLPSATNFSAALSDVVAYEQAGLDIAWVGESYGFDAVSAMGALAVATKRVLIGSSVMGLYSRTPAMTAMSIAGVDALSGGRAMLGLGASGPQVVEGWHGVPFNAPLSRTREVVDICRQIWRRERLQHDGRYYRIPLPKTEGMGLGKPLMLIKRPERDRVPIFLAALGTKNVALAAEIADGWMPAFVWPEKIKHVWGESIDAGMARRNEDLGPLDVVATAYLAIGDECAPLVDVQRPHVSHYIGGMGARSTNFYNDVVCRYGFEKEASLIQDLYLDGRKQEAAAAVPAELLDHISVVGTLTHAEARIRAYHDAGVTILNVYPIGDSTEERAEQVRRLRQLIDSMNL